MAVSYTHLDVYKRQMENSSETEVSRDEIVRVLAETLPASR